MRRISWLLSLPLALSAACGSDDGNGGNGNGDTGMTGGNGVVVNDGLGANNGGVTGMDSTGAGTGNGAMGGDSTGTDSMVGTTGGGDGSGTVNGGAAGTGDIDMGGDMAGQANGDCEGFSMEGLIYSPGGDVLPNTCMPFDPTTNNPYAVRCVDAWPWYETQFPGDNFCILPPPPDKGVQYGVHPQGADWFTQVSTGDMSGYDGVGGEWTLQPGGEGERNYLTGLQHEPFNFYRAYVRMRAGSHHMIISADTGTATESWGPGGPDGLFAGTSLPGAQRPDENTPKSLEKPVEDAGLYGQMPVNPAITFNMHHFNATDSNILKEAWTNLWFEDDATVPVRGIRGLTPANLAMAMQPGQTTDFHHSVVVAQPTRVISLFGHRHAWTTNFSSWVDKAAGGTDILYQSFDWYDEPTYRYDSANENPMPAHENRVDGGATGVYTLQPGDELHFNCHVEYTEERAQAVNAPAMPVEQGTLRFSNQAFAGEMCILFGQTAEIALPGFAVPSGSPLPDFAQK